MMMDDKDWDAFSAWLLEESIRAAGDGPVMTGDPVIDAYEREEWERNRRA